MRLTSSFGSTAPDSAGGGAAIEFERVRVAYGPTSIIERLDLQINSGEFVCVVGPSGCGKSTLLRGIGDLTDIGGQIHVDGSTPTEAWDKLAYVFQQPRLLRWRTAIDNVVLGIQLRDMDGTKEQLKSKANTYLQMMDLGELASRPAHLLSGGEQQRVAIARALAVEPKALMMDEPFSALDVATRRALRNEIVRIWRETGLTVVFVTHDVDEAIYVGSRVIVLSDKPTEVLADIRIDLEHPRNPESESFRSIHDDVVHHFGGVSTL